MIAELFLALAQASKAKPAKPKPPPAADVRAQKAFDGLEPSERKDVIDFLEGELEHLTTFQMSLVRWSFKHQDRDPLMWPAARETPFFDPAKHAPAQPIARQRLAATDSRAQAALRDMRIPEDRRAWVYDWGTGDVLHHVQRDTAERAFERALAGMPPRLDLVNALLERALDDGSQRKSLAAFGHAYTDRAGNVFPGITLFDAWKSGREIEMPDVDALGIVNTVLDDWTTWTSVVPAEKHDALYARIGELFQPAKKHRELRGAIAATFLVGAPPLCCGYEATLDNFHSLWEDCASTPETLAQRLPPAAQAQEFLAAFVKSCYEGDLYQKGIQRRAALSADGAVIRATLERVLDEYGAFAPREGGVTKKKDRAGDRR